MRSFVILIGRELASTFHSFGFYALTALVAAVTGFSFQAALLATGYDMTGALGRASSWLFWLTVLMTPLLTMRLFAEEKRSGSLELLMTTPVSDVAVVMAKFAGAALVFGVIMTPIWICNLILTLFFDSSPDYGQLSSYFIGLFTLGLVCLALGTLSSAVSSAQLWAGLLAIVGNFVLLMVGATADLLPKESVFHSALSYVNLQDHLLTSAYGIADLKHVVVHLSLAGLFLFWTVRVVEMRKWK